jgi:hypothetical protein
MKSFNNSIKQTLCACLETFILTQLTFVLFIVSIAHIVRLPVMHFRFPQQPIFTDDVMHTIKFVNDASEECDVSIVEVEL